MNKVIDYVSEKEGKQLDLKKLMIELFDDNVDLNQVYKMIKDTSA